MFGAEEGNPDRSARVPGARPHAWLTLLCDNGKMGALRLVPPRWSRASALSLALVFAAACGSDRAAGPAHGAGVASVDIVLASATLEPGDSLLPRVILRDSNNDVIEAPVSWSSANPAVAAVSSSGVLHAVNPGATAIFATAHSGARDSLAVQVSVHFAFVGVGSSHTCALDGRGKAFCWGYGGLGSLGSGFTPNLVSPTAVAGDLIFTQLGVGAAHSCGLTSDGAAHCWGLGLYGRLGDGTTSDRATPVLVLGSLQFTQISAGGNLTCGLAAGGAAYCWGDGYMGGLGDGAYAAESMPVAVRGGAAFTRIVAGSAHVCALTGSGAAYCWGQNWAGQNGVGTTATNHTQPVAVVGGLSFTALTTAGDYSCGLTTTGEAYCWGRAGALGTSSAGNQLLPVRVEGGLIFTKITAGGQHTCALTAAGAAYCWGAGDFGRLGNGATVNAVTPGAVSGGLVFADLSAGVGHTCGVTTDHRTYCWGSNDMGQLGNGQIGGSLAVPTPVVWAP
jgi:alpha-tubulin suppressor-like RCC1 family protein